MPAALLPPRQGPSNRYFTLDSSTESELLTEVEGTGVVFFCAVDIKAIPAKASKKINFLIIIKLVSESTKEIGKTGNWLMLEIKKILPDLR
jgi:hypothetical protein